ncbi:MAG: transporter [Acidimicrobiaceae bacterium]|nr:transporter [Acidimicrobiaceae bacterium]
MTDIGRASIGWADSQLRQGAAQLTNRMGGTARRRAILLLAAVISLQSADQGAIGAVAPQLEPALHISNTELGLLVTVTALAGGLATIPMGILVDRSHRIRLLRVAIVLWGIAELAGSFSPSYGVLIGTRVGLAVVTASAVPAVASLTGDLFPAGERGRIYGLIVSGELVGAGFGIIISGLLSGWAGWRPALGILALPSIGLAWYLGRLPEPARGGQSWIPEGAEEIISAEEAEEGEGPTETASSSPVEAAEEGSEILAQVEAQGVHHDEAAVVAMDPETMSLRAAIGYVLRVRSNVAIVVASSLGYFFFAGLKTFGLLFARGHFRIGQGLATVVVAILGLGALAGVILAGRGADRLIARGHIAARIDIGVVGYIVAAVLLVPVFLTSSLPASIPLLLLAGAAIAAPNPTLDAARLDVVPSQLWGRAEAVRTVAQTTLEAFAPLVFGLLSAAFGGSAAGFAASAGSGTSSPAGTPHQVHGLEDAFLIMLVPLALSGLVLLFAHRSYPVDVASAAESERRINEPDDRPPVENAQRHPGTSS